ncbi:pyridoxamine 5'-phosphate oxidase family protein [Sorangium sp. So ce375]|uniref:flavin-nucleotide-binding protein n=1 Tax=Sorangium sp. So ce375 TaxID=3133306 RepID=UPI003F5B3946
MTSLPGWTREGSPYHPGEMAVQTRAGARERAEKAGRRIIRDFMPDQHRELFAQLPFLLVGALDEERRPWASIVTGRPGFIASPDPRTLAVNARPAAGDPLGAHLVAGAPVGLLGVQLETRRRNRLNGTITAADERGFVVEVGQSFGNCAQYIQAREPMFVREPEAAAAPREAQAEGAALSAGAAALIRRADTFFIATASPFARGGDAIEGADVSHRGGKPGFVRVTEQDGRTVLTSPDFTGNFAFNTLGNLALDPRAGVLFVDFASGGVLSLTGEAEVIWDGAELSAFAGAQRLLRFRVAGGVWREDAVPLRWSAPVPAPQLAATGSWEDVARG